MGTEGINAALKAGRSTTQVGMKAKDPGTVHSSKNDVGTLRAQVGQMRGSSGSSGASGSQGSGNSSSSKEEDAINAKFDAQKSAIEAQEKAATSGIDGQIKSVEKQIGDAQKKLTKNTETKQKNDDAPRFASLGSKDAPIHGANTADIEQLQQQIAEMQAQLEQLQTQKDGIAEQFEQQLDQLEADREVELAQSKLGDSSGDNEDPQFAAAQAQAVGELGGMENQLDIRLDSMPQFSK